MRRPTIKPRNGRTKQDLYERIVKAEQLDLDGIDLQSCVNDLEKLPENWRAEPFKLLARGYPSPCVVDFIMAHTIRGLAVQHLNEDDWLIRVEVARRDYVTLAPGVEETSAEQWAADLGIATGEASDAVQPPDQAADGADSAGRAAQSSKTSSSDFFVYNTAQEAEIMQRVRQLPPSTQDLIVQLYLNRLPTESMSVVLGQCSDGAILSKGESGELLYALELVRRRLDQLESAWVLQHTQEAVQPSYDAKTEYLRRAMRDGLRISEPSGIEQRSEQFRFTLEDVVHLLPYHFATLPL